MKEETKIDKLKQKINRKLTYLSVNRIIRDQKFWATKKQIEKREKN